MQPPCREARQLCQRLALALAVWLTVRLAPVGSQELPSLSPERRQLAEALLAACVKEGGLAAERTPGGQQSLRLTSREKLRRTLAAHKEWRTPKARDALAAYWTTTDEEGGEVIAVLLKEHGRATGDAQALGLAAYFTAAAAGRAMSHEQAVPAYRQAVQYFQAASQPAWAALALDRLAQALQLLGADAEASGYLRQALALRRQLYPPGRFPAGHRLLALTLAELGSALLRQEELAEAATYLRQALAMRRRLYPPAEFPEGHHDLAASLRGLGLVLHARGAETEAAVYLEQALAMRRKLYPKDVFPLGHPELAASLRDLGPVYQALGKSERAAEGCRQALEMHQAIYTRSLFPLGHPEVARSFNALGEILEARGANPQALEAYGDAIQVLRTSAALVPLDGGPDSAPLLRPRPDAAEFLRHRAALLFRDLPERASAAQLRKVERTIALATTVHDRLRGGILRNAADQLRQGEKADPLLPARLLLLGRLFDAEHKVEDLRQAFTALEAGRARVFLESLGQAHAATLAGLPPRFAAEEHRLSLALRQLDARIERLSRQPGDRAARQLRQLSADRLKLEEKERRFLDRLRRSHSRYAGFRHPRPCSIEQARSCLGQNEVALLFAVGRDFSCVLLLEKTPRPGDRGEGIALVRLPGSKELSPLLGTLLAPETLQRPGRARELAADVYARLLGPLAQRLKGKDLLIVPDGALALLPFEILIEGQTDEQDGNWLIERHRVRYAPSLTALRLSRLIKRDKPARLLWALADPIFNGKFAVLKHSGREVESICKVLGVPAEQTVRGVKASEAAVKAAREELAQARFVHFATHGLVSERSAYETALVLNQVGNDGKEQLGGINDGLLRLPEITFLKLNADVVVLSACETARGRRSGGEGVSGLARAFLYAGSKGVVCSLWSVDDARTADLMTAFYGHLKAGEPATEALHQAQLALMRKGLAPFFWAPFVLMGQ